MIVLSGLLKPSESRPRSISRAKQTASLDVDRSSTSSDASAYQLPSGHISDVSQLETEAPDAPDLKELNNSLAALAAIFPDVQVEVFREMLSSFDEQSRLAVITESLLKNKIKWVRGRYRISAKEEADTDKARRDTRGIVPDNERFRSLGYRTTVKNMAYSEFKGLSHSTIKAVLAEHNHSYTLSRPTLVSLHGKTWRYSISTIFSRAKKTSQETDEHPLVVWCSTGHGSIIPTLKSTGDTELDKELFQSLVVPLQAKVALDRATKDHAFALELNNTEAEKSDALYDCECCFTSTTFEELTACNGGAHFICFQCIRHAVNEAVFGQGWSRNIDHDTGSLRCLAPSSDDCDGCIPQELMQRALLEEKSGSDILRKLDERLVEDSLLKAQLPLVRCPFCSYAEVDQIYLPASQPMWRVRLSGSSISTISILILGVGMIPFLFPIFLIASFAFLVLCTQQSFSSVLITTFQSSLQRMRRRKHGLRFTCQNPRCSRASCMSCNKAWTDIHICHESSLLALRTQVELAMSLAIKRTCPRCNTSFVKSSGCNKLTCVCGYQMCYVCRKDIGNGEGYRHFCEHFRPNGGRGCSECNKCDLYRCEDDEVVVSKAKEEAERRWVEKEGVMMEGREEVRKVLIGKGKDMGIWGRWKMPDWDSLLDTVIQSIVE